MRKVRLLSRLAPGALAAAILFAGPVVIDATEAARADAGGCARVHKALENVVTTPAHAYTKETSSRRGATETEAIYLDGKVYVLMKGRWTLSPDSALQMVETLRQSRKHATLACKVIGEETVGDRTATVYATTRQTGDSKNESKLWIDKVSGLLLKQEEILTAGADNTVHRSTRYEYGNVTAPKLAE